MNSYYQSRRQFHDRESEKDNESVVVVFLVLIALSLVAYIAVSRFHVRPHQIVEGCLYLISTLPAASGTLRYLQTFKERLEDAWPHPPLHISPKSDAAAVRTAFSQNSVVLGYDVYGRPWFWPDAVRVMQAILFGQTGSGKTTLLRNIITQDVRRDVGSPERPQHIPMIILDGKGDQEFLEDLLPHIEAARRMRQLRILNPSRPDISARYNPLYFRDGSYQEHANLVFQSFDLKHDFFYGHHATYLSD